MKILAIDSSGLTASCAVLSDGIITAEYTTDYAKTHSQTLLPMIDEIVRMTELDLNELDAVAVAQGPGSFTGLRIGAATAKGLCMAINKPVIPVPTVDGLAYNLAGCGDIICPLMNARRSETYTGIYEFKNGEMNIIKPQCVLPLSAIIGEINDIGRPAVFLGDGVEEFLSAIKETAKVTFNIAPPHLKRQRAGSVAALGERLFSRGETVDATDFAPVYLRLSQAEREKLEKERALQDSGSKPKGAVS